MAKASTTELFSVSADKIYDAILDFESYPNFLPEVKSCKILGSTETTTDVEMTVNFVKEATYSIRVQSEKNKKVWWEFVEGDFFKKNNGLWELEAIGSQTQVKYSLDVDFKIFVPGMILKKAVAVSLPAMVKNFKKRVE